MSARNERKDAPSESKKTGPRCPVCGKPASLEHRPFCSKRCADIDLGRWLKGSYAVPGEPIRDEDIENESKDD